MADEPEVDATRTVERLAELDKTVANLAIERATIQSDSADLSADGLVADAAIADLSRAIDLAAETNGTLARTYRYLRLVMIATVPAIVTAIVLVIALELPAGTRLPSVSHYYYTPAGVVFIGALVAAAAALLALAGTGVERVLLLLAAFFAPLIALIPAPVGGDALVALSLACPEGVDECVPAPFDSYVDISVTVWLSAVVAAVVVGLLIAWRSATPAKPIPRSVWVSAGLLAALTITYFLWWRASDDGNFDEKAHVVSASTFFVIITLVVIAQARKPPFRTLTQAATDQPASPWQQAIPKVMWVIAGLMVIDLVPVGLIFLGILDPITHGVPTIVFWVELFGLTLFGLFWVIQTSRKWNDPDA